MDKLDLQIIRELESDGRISFASLASRVGLSKTPCWNRVKELQKRGVIKGFKTVLDQHALGLGIQAIVHVVVNFNQSNEFEKAIDDHKHVLDCFAVTGDFDYVLRVIATDVSHLDKLLRRELCKVPGVERFSTAIATRTIKDEAKLSDIV